MKEKELTFKPKINSLSTIAILNKNKTGQKSNSNFEEEKNIKDVSKRLFNYQNKYKESLEIKRKKFKKNYTFKPKISKNTDLILNNKKIKENENNLNNVVEDENNNELKNKNSSYKNYLKSNEILLKQKKLEKLEEISKRIRELSEENMVNTEEKAKSPIKNSDKKNKKLKKSKIINEKKEV